jgi:hypothetical protein
VQAIKAFYIHASTFVLVNIGLFVINLLTGGGWWFYWPLIGWGIGLGARTPWACSASAVEGPGVGSERNAGPER